ncbi:MAG: putative J domain-containing protein [Satyrvirus sp.]|uniref:Putative J domain-containing protein n=1 Tax=Satyrvirus sp. TaxID=2487771 RepID=A0A3G5AFL1_9VIRU|nr:MAG: putative J domain-containing protein [Satyrvirus sp.]
MSTQYKHKNELPNLYDMLGLSIDVCKDPKCNKLIQKAYIKKAKVCHPDKHPGRKDVEEIFELITRAYDVLKDEKTRSEYNHKLSLNKQSSSDFFKLKKSANDFMETMGEYKPPTKQQELSFKEQMNMMDEKHGFDPSLAGIISEQDTKKKLNEILKQRIDQHIELMPENLFGNGSFDLKKFNGAFEMVHKKDDTSVVTYNGVPSAWNGQGTTTNFSNFDNLDNLYVEDPTRYDTSKQTFGNIDFGSPAQKLSKDDMVNIQVPDYVDQHNVIEENYYDTVKEKLLERKNESSKIKKMEYNDFKRNDTAGYGIFDQLLGYAIDDRLMLDVEDDDISKRYDKLLADRQTELSAENGTNKKKKHINDSR